MGDIDRPYISIVVPAFNESDKIAWTIEKISSFFEKKNYPFEIIVADDASKDQTFSIVSGLIPKYPWLKAIKLEKNGEKAGAVKEGVLRASGRYILFTDADLSTSIEQVDKLLTTVVTGGYDIAIGSRGLRLSKLVASQGFMRKMMGRIYGHLINMLLISDIRDTQCGFKLFRHEASQEIFNRLTIQSALFDLEVLLIALKLGYRVAEIPVTWSHNPDTRLKLNLRTSLKRFVELFRLKYQWAIIFPYKAKK